MNLRFQVCVPWAAALSMLWACESETPTPEVADTASDAAVTLEVLGSPDAQADADAAPTPDAPVAEVTADAAPEVSVVPQYACGWPMNDPGDLTATGSGVGDVIADFGGTDQCGEHYRLWDGHGRYTLVLSPVFW